MGGFFTGSGQFKAGQIKHLKRRFANIQLAIGDKPSDSNAYLQNNIPSILIPDIDWEKDKAEYWHEQLRQMQGVDPQVTVCRDWFEIEEAVFKHRKFPPKRMLDKIKGMANLTRDN